MTEENIIPNLQSIYKNAHNEDSTNNLISLISEEYLQELEKTSQGEDHKPSPSENKNFSRPISYIESNNLLTIE